MTELTLFPKNGRLNDLCEFLDGQSFSYAVDDPSEIADFIANNRQYWDYFDELLTAERPATVKIYVGEDFDVSPLLPLLDRYSQQLVNESDWADSWKPYWQATPIGENLVIVPSWKTILRLDPGMLFGTGTHATTALCLAALEKSVPFRNCLDLGCGSGILTIAAMLLGAESAYGYDIDENMPKIANENAALNNVVPTFIACDIFNADICGKFDVITANIVADVIIRLAPKIPQLLSENGRFICSGIISERSPEVETALAAENLRLIERTEQDDWVALVCGV